jgi:hypothetical protein
MSQQFIKKPLVIEAFLLGSAIRPKWAEQDHIKYYIGFAIINTLEGEMRAEDGDYIIKGIKGEIYPCKADIFEASYSAVNTPFVAQSDEVFNPHTFKLEPSNLIPIQEQNPIHEILIRAYELAEKLNRPLCFGITSEDRNSFAAPFFLGALIEQLEIISVKKEFNVNETAN